MATGNRYTWRRQMLTPEGWRCHALRKQMRNPTIGSWRYKRFVAHTIVFVPAYGHPLHKMVLGGVGLQCEVELNGD